MKAYNCPNCGKQLVRLEPFERGVYEFWCDDCDTEIKITKNGEEEMKKYTLKNYKEFCEDALIMPPLDDEDNLQEWFDTHKIQIITNDCVMELDYDADAVNEIEFSLGEIHEAILGSGEPTTGNMVAENDCGVAMTGDEFKTKLSDVFKTHLFMKDRNRHTINELLYVLEHDSRFTGNDFNISIRTLGGYWTCIPCLDTFVPTQVREMWFNDADVEFEVEKVGEEQYNCITIYESEGV